MQAEQSVLAFMENRSIAEITSEGIDELRNRAEDDLIRRCQRGDGQAMESLVHQYQNQVYNTAYGILGNPDDAQDLTQDVFLCVWEKIRQFQFRARFSTWLYRIALNLSINERNRRKRRQTSPAEMDDSQPWVPINTTTPEQGVLLAEKQEMLNAALKQLKDSYREILILREMENLSYDELADILGCSIGRVKSRLHEARMELRRILKQKDR